MDALPVGWRSRVRTQAANTISVTPAAGTIIADSGALPTGIYNMQVAGSYGAVADVVDNMAVFLGAVRVMSLPVAPVVNGAPMFVYLPGLLVNEGEHLTIRAVAAGGAGSVFRGTLVATPVTTLDVT